VIAIEVLLGVSTYRVGEVRGMRRAVAGQQAHLTQLDSELRRYEQALQQLPAAQQGPLPAGMTAEQYRVLVHDLRKQLLDDLDAVPISVTRTAAASFIPITTFDADGRKLMEGTAASLGKGYFLTVKHVVYKVSDDAKDVARVAIKTPKRLVNADVIDMGAGMGPAVFADDWAILRARGAVDVPPIEVDTSFPFDLATRVVRIGNDYSNGIVASDGIIGTRQTDGLVSCLTDGHKGSSGGGIIDARGVHVGIPVGRMNEDHRYSFIQPLSKQMFRKVPHLR
jgi:hypothetical protein